ncbi:MAG: glycosyltransferase family 2 protein [Patescibacteria group bacterium]|nr:glycosyltransferase family 2 protein [Patescibacteria group bacterium]
MKDQKVSCIIPVYNEEKTVAKVVDLALKTPQIGELIVVNDGSTDNSIQNLTQFKDQIKIINLEKNHGKGYAIAQGIRKAKLPYILLLDADLINLKPFHISSIINPVLEQDVKMSVGDVLSNGVPLYSFLWQFSGQRCLPKKEIKPLLKKIEQTNYAMEIILNEAFRDSTVVVPLPSTKQLRVKKHEKDRNAFLGSTGFISGILEISQSIVAHKSKEYQQKFNEDLVKSIATYLNINAQKLKDFIQKF